MKNELYGQRLRNLRAASLQRGGAPDADAGAESAGGPAAGRPAHAES
jgi:hypothetical protein